VRRSTLDSSSPVFVEAPQSASGLLEVAARVPHLVAFVPLSH
jgi:hypothetical protein